MEFSIVQPNQLKHIQLVQAETGSALKYKHRDLLDQNVPSLQEYIEKQIHVPKVQQILLKSCGTQLELTKNLFETLPAVKFHKINIFFTPFQWIRGPPSIFSTQGSIPRNLIQNLNNPNNWNYHL